MTALARALGVKQAELPKRIEELAAAAAGSREIGADATGSTTRSRRSWPGPSCR